MVKRLLVAVVLAAVLAGCSGSPSRVVAGLPASPSPTLTPAPGPSAEPSGSPSPSLVPSRSPSPAPRPSPSPTKPTPSPTKPPPSPSPSPSTLSPSPFPEPSPAPSGEPDCAQSSLVTAVHTDRPTYPSGADVAVTIDVTNSGSAACAVAMPYPETFGSTVQILDSSGSVVWAPGPRAEGVLALPQPINLNPGQSYTWTTVMWDQHYC